MSKRCASMANRGSAKKSKGGSLASQLASLVDPTPRAQDDEDDHAEFTRLEDIDYGMGSDDEDRMAPSGRLRMHSAAEDTDERYRGRIVRSPEASDEESDEEDGSESMDDGSDDGAGEGISFEEFAALEESGDEDEDAVSGEEEEEEDSASRFQKELEQLQQEEQQVLEGISKVKDEEVEQATAVKVQKKMWVDLLEFRIALQGCLSSASRLPKPDVFAGFAADPLVQHRLEQVQELATDTINDLRVVSENLLANDETVSKSCGELPEMIAHEEPGDLWDGLAAEHEATRPWVEAEINRWGRKTMVSKQLQGGKALQSLAKSAMEQVHEVMSDMPRLLKRTQLKRGEYKIIGDVVAPVDTNQETSSKRDTHLQQHDEEVFDDTDFYERLLQELIESGSQASLQAALIGRTAVKKSKTKVDTRASKGRKIRYQVHPKLVNYMYANGFDMPPVAEELFARLFGQAPERE